ncbi:hypothetical protein D3C84_568340 [compost metagenome]
MHAPEQQRRTNHSGNGVAFAEDREEVAEGAEQQDEVTDVTQPGTDPVTPRGGETHVVAESGLGVGVDPAVQVRFAIGECLEHEGECQHAYGSDGPTDQHRADVGTGGHVLGQRKDPATNHRADNQRNKCTEFQFSGGFRHCMTPMQEKRDNRVVLLAIQSADLDQCMVTFHC